MEMINDGDIRQSKSLLGRLFSTGAAMFSSAASSTSASTSTFSRFTPTRSQRTQNKRVGACVFVFVVTFRGQFRVEKRDIYTSRVFGTRIKSTVGIGDPLKEEI